MGKSFDRSWRVRRSRNVMRPVTRILVDTVRKVEAAEYLVASTPVVSTYTPTDQTTAD